MKRLIRKNSLCNNCLRHNALSVNNIKSENGFTLVELLAVIVILGIIMLIAVPLILGVINDARKGAFRSSAYGIIKSTENEHLKLMFNNEKINELLFTYNNGVESSNPTGKKLNYKGTKPISGTVVTNKEGKIAIALFNGKWCAEKDYNESKVTLSDKSQQECNIVVPLPTIELIGNNPQYVEINTDYVEEGVIAKSIEGNVITDIDITIKENNKVEDKVNTSKLKKYDVIYSVIDNNKEVILTREVIVRDTIKPVLVVPTLTTIEDDEVNDFNYLEGVSVSDNSLEELEIKISGNISRLPGVYDITYSAEDSSGNATSVVRIIKVENSIKTMTITIPEGSVDEQDLSTVISIPKLKSIVNVTVDTGTIIHSINGDDLTLNARGGISNRTVNNPQKESKTVSDVIDQTVNTNFPVTKNYNNDGYIGTLNKSGTHTQTGGSAAGSMNITEHTSAYYNSGGYTGTLTQYLYSGGIVSADRKSVNIRVCQDYWNNASCFSIVPNTHYYNESGYSGTLWMTDCHGGCAFYEGDVYRPESDTRVYRYRGTVTKPDTRTYRQSYLGTVYKAGYDNYYSYKVTIEYRLAK